MTRQQQRLWLIIGGVGVLTLAVLLMMSALRDNIVFFYSPSELGSQQLAAGQTIRIGGLVKKDSVDRVDGLTTRFVVTDLEAELIVSHTGILPDLFREGQGVVAQGSLGQDGVFIADEVLAKHDENYMPKEVADSLKDKGHWKDGEPYYGDSGVMRSE